MGLAQRIQRRIRGTERPNKKPVQSTGSFRQVCKRADPVYPGRPFGAYLLTDSLAAVAALEAASAADLAASAPASLAASAALWTASLVASAAAAPASLAASTALEAAALASAAASLAASAAALAASLAASTAGAATGAGASTGAGAGAGTAASSFLPQAASATAAIIDARTRDFFIWIFLTTVDSCETDQGKPSAQAKSAQHKVFNACASEMNYRDYPGRLPMTSAS